MGVRWQGFLTQTQPRGKPMCPRLRGHITPCGGTSAFALGRICRSARCREEKVGTRREDPLKNNPPPKKNTRTISAAAFMSCDVFGLQCQAPWRAGAPTSDCCCQSGLPQNCGRWHRGNASSPNPRHEHEHGIVFAEFIGPGRRQDMIIEWLHLAFLCKQCKTG